MNKLCLAPAILHLAGRWNILGFMTNRLQLLLLAIWFFSACSNEPSKVSNPKASKSDSGQSAQLLDTVLSFSGIWVNEAYINKIKENHSPRQSQDIGKSCIIIPSRTLKVTRMIYGFHDGGADMIIQKEGNRYLFCDPVSKEIEDSIIIISPAQIRIDDQYFSRLRHQDTTMINLGILEEILFKGRYRLADGSEVVFSEDGSVKGLDSFEVYIPAIDYTTESAVVDYMQLGSSRNKLQNFGFLFNKDTLCLYKITCLEYDSASHNCEKDSLGEPIYKLTKLDP